MIVNGDADTQQPLRGVVLCCTSIEPEIRTELAAWAAEMGAEHKLDLTSDVTHLIVGETQTPKYKYVAREREDVKCLGEKWIPAVRETWMEGGDVPLQLLEDQYRLPTFHQLKICITGFEDPDQRKELETLINKHGGEYRGDLRKECTHLVCFTPAGSKYTSAKSWGNICTVSIEWLTMSIERGLILDEQYFDPSLPPEVRGKDAWKRMERRSPSLKRTRTNDMQMGPARKLRRTASARLGADAVWQDLTHNEATKAAVIKAAEVSDGRFSAAATAVSGFQSNASTNTLHGSAGQANASVPDPPERRGVFFGKRFLLHGFDSRRVQLLRQHLECQDAEVESDAMVFSQQSATSDIDASFTIIPHCSSNEEASSAPQVADTQIVTELWVEKCLHNKACIEPQPIHVPFKHPVAGFDKLSISSTGFEGVDLMHVTKVVKLLGATYSDSMTKKTSLVLCQGGSVTTNKFKHAIAWNTPAVKVSWLWECVRLGECKAWDEFLEQPNLQNKTPMQKSAPIDFEGRIPAMLGTKKQLLGRSLGSVNDALSISKPIAADMSSGKKAPEQLASREQVKTAPTTHMDAKRHSRANSVTAPLREVSPNLQPPAIETAENGDPTLVSSLHSLLARTRKQGSQAATDSCKSIKPPKRRILGRARSDLSTRSTVSRAGSIDSVNTDGMGTPLEAGSRPSPVKPKARPVVHEDDAGPLSAELLLSNELQDNRHDEDMQAPPLTQIGYDDSEAVIWRAKLAKKMSASKEDVPETAHDGNDQHARKPVLKDSGGTISKRTRLNTR